jgi:hypothetical protein
MGLELVELKIAVEQQFGVKLAAEFPARLRTPGELINHICASVAAMDDGRCASQRSFHRVRRALVETGLARDAVRPDATLEATLPMPQRKVLWPQLAKRLGVRRKLQRPRWLVIAVVAAAAATFALVRSSALPLRGVLACAGAALVALAAVLVTRPASVRLPGTVGELAREAVPAMAAEVRVTRGEAWTRTEVSEIVRQLVRELSGVSDPRDDADLVKDLGMR